MPLHVPRPNLRRIVKHLGPPQGYMVIPPVKDRGVHNPVRRKRHHRPNESPGQDIVPVMRHVNSQHTSLQRRPEQRREQQRQPPDRGAVVAPDLQLGVHPQEKKHEPAKRRRRVARGEGHHGAPHRGPVRVGAHVGRVHDLLEPDAVEARRVVRRRGREGDVGLADDEEVGAEPADEDFDDDLEEGAEEEGVADAHGAVVGVPEGADAELGEEDDGDGDEGGDEARDARGDGPAAGGVGEGGVDDVAGLGEGYGEGMR